MKRLLALCFIILAAVTTSVAAKDPGTVVWDSTSHDFGTIHASAGKVKAEYTFTNNSSTPLAIVGMTNGGCGCTVPSYSRKPVPAHGKSTVSVTFDPAKFKGEFRRQVQVTFMVGDKRIKCKLKFSGHIIP